MIGITGVTGKLGAYVAEMIAANGQKAIHLARTPERAKHYPGAEIRQAWYDYSTQTVAALTGVKVLLMVSARENPQRVQEHKDFLDAAKATGVEHIIYTSFYGASDDATFTLSRDHAKTERYIRKLGFTYTFLRDNFYLDFFKDIALDAGEIRGPSGNGKVSAVARKDTSAVAARILQEPEKWANQTLNLTGPEALTMEEIVTILSQSTGKKISYHNETVEEAYESRKKWPAQPWEYDAWVSTYTAIQAGEQDGVSNDIERVLGRTPLRLQELLEREPKSKSRDSFD